MERTQFVGDLANRIETAVSSVFVGPRETVRLATLGLLSGLHILVEDIPGVGKTTLALALSRAGGMGFSRIQFTPDMLPGDVLGMNVWDPERKTFTFREGPIHGNVVLADELNRTSPRTQSAFLEAMQEGQITVDGVTRPLPSPFFLIATQNPNTFAGTFPLPEAELDRFGLSLSIGYPDEAGETEILKRTVPPGSQRDIPAVAGAEEIARARGEIDTVHVSDETRAYIVNIVRETRASALVRLGGSPRAAIFLQHAAKANAALDGRDFVIPEDAEALAPAVLSHRIQLASQARLERIDARTCVRDICAGIRKPTGL